MVNNNGKNNNENNTRKGIRNNQIDQQSLGRTSEEAINSSYSGIFRNIKSLSCVMYMVIKVIKKIGLEILTLMVQNFVIWVVVKLP